MREPPTSAESAMLAAVPEAAATGRRLDAERLRLVCRAVVRTPVGVLPATAFIAYIMAPHFGAWRAWGWMALMVAVWSTRAIVCAGLLRKPPPPARVRFWIRYVVTSAALSGLVGGAAAVLFFPAPPVEAALMTMVICGWCAAGIAVSGAVPLAFYGLIVPFMAPLAVAWPLSGAENGWLVALLLVMFIFLLVTYARDGAELVARALRVGFENEDLAHRLQAREAEAQAARARAEAANVSKSSFLAAASHDLRQPLHALSLLLATLQERTHDAIASEMLDKIAISAASLDNLFKGLLDLSRFDAGAVRVAARAMPLGPMLARLENDFGPLAARKGLALRCASSGAWIESDPEMLERILRNLLDNAVKYTERGGVEVAVEEGADTIAVSVRDSGIGIDPAHRARIFEEYYQIRNPARNRAQGIGLGLAIVKRMCDVLGHGIEVSSERGNGSVFRVELARAEAPAAPQPAGAPPQAKVEQLHGLVIVVIEDDAEVQDAMRLLLEGWGCRAVLAASGADALARLREAGLRPDAVIADYRLAGTETGFDAIAALCAVHGDLPAAIVTGEMNPAALRAPDTLSVVVMQKPVRALEIRDWLLLWKSLD